MVWTTRSPLLVLVLSACTAGSEATTGGSSEDSSGAPSGSATLDEK